MNEQISSYPQLRNRRNAIEIHGLSIDLPKLKATGCGESIIPRTSSNGSSNPDREGLRTPYAPKAGDNCSFAFGGVSETSNDIPRPASSEELIITHFSRPPTSPSPISINQIENNPTIEIPIINPCPCTYQSPIIITGTNVSQTSNIGTTRQPTFIPCQQPEQIWAPRTLRQTHPQIHHRELVLAQMGLHYYRRNYYHYLRGAIRSTMRKFTRNMGCLNLNKLK